MPATKHPRRSKTRPRWASAPPPRPPHRPISEEDRREDALLEGRLHRLFGPAATVHQFGDIDWTYEQYQQALAQLEAEGLIRPADEVVG
jgi:hypothetical protein